MSDSVMSRRQFAGILAAAPSLAQNPPESHVGNLYPVIQAIADASPHPMSFLRSEFTDLAKWQGPAREKLLDLLQYRPAAAPPEVQLISRKEREGFIEESLTFRTTPQLRVPAHVLIPADRKPPFPGVVVL